MSFLSAAGAQHFIVGSKLRPPPRYCQAGACGIVDAQAGELRSVALRPEAVSLDEVHGAHNQRRGTIEEVSFLGSIMRIRVRFKENAVSLDTFNDPGVSPPERGQPATVSFAREDLLVLEGAEAG